MIEFRFFFIFFNSFLFFLYSGFHLWGQLDPVRIRRLFFQCSGVLGCDFLFFKAVVWLIGNGQGPLKIETLVGSLISLFPVFMANPLIKV